MADKDPGEATSHSGCVIKPSAKQKALDELGTITKKADSRVKHKKAKKGKGNSLATSNNALVTSTGDPIHPSTPVPAKKSNTPAIVEIEDSNSTESSSEDDEAKLGQFCYYLFESGYLAL